VGKAWLVGGLGAKAADEAPAHSGYLVERWPLMVVPHAADIVPGLWAGPASGVAGDEPPAAPYVSEAWNGQRLDHFVSDPESEWRKWDDSHLGRQIELVRTCLKVFFLPYYTLLDAHAVAEAHALERSPDAVLAAGAIAPQARTWAQEVQVADLGLASFLILRTPIEPGDAYEPKLAAAKVIRHPSDNSPVILDPSPEILDTAKQPPLLCGIEVDDGGVHRLLWPALRTWRPLADDYRPAAQEVSASLPTDVAYACRATGVAPDMARELLGFLSSFGPLGGGAWTIGELAPELLAAELVRNHPADPAVVPEGMTAGHLVRPFVWPVSAGLNVDEAQAQRRHLWLFDHRRIVDLLKAAERTAGGDLAKWSAAMQIWLRREGKEIGKGLPCWVRIEDQETLGVGSDDWAGYAADNLLVRRLYEAYARDYPFQRKKSVEVIAGRSGTEPAAG